MVMILATGLISSPIPFLDQTFALRVVLCPCCVRKSVPDYPDEDFPLACKDFVCSRCHKPTPWCEGNGEDDTCDRCRGLP